MTPRRARVAAVLFAMALLDVAAWRGLWLRWMPAADTVGKAVFEHASDGRTLDVGVAPWAYPMVPAPRFVSRDTLVVPPGFPVAVEMRAGDAFDVDVYEADGPLVVLARGDAWSALLVEDGVPVARRLGEEAPPMQAFEGLARCFPSTERTWRVARDDALSVVAGAPPRPVRPCVFGVWTIPWWHGIGTH